MGPQSSSKTFTLELYEVYFIVGGVLFFFCFVFKMKTKILVDQRVLFLWEVFQNP